MYRPNLLSVALAVPEIIVIAVLGWGRDLSLPNLGEREAVRDRGWHRSKERWRLPIGSL